MLINCCRYSGIILSALVTGCSNPIESCSYLTLEDVKDLDSAIVERSYERRIPKHPTNFCVWKDITGEDLLLINVGLETQNTPYAILDTFKGDDSVEYIAGVGNGAAAMFSSKDGEENLEIFLVQNDRWTLDMRSKLVGGIDSEEFEILKKLATKVFTNLD